MQWKPIRSVANNCQSIWRFVRL